MSQNQQQGEKRQRLRLAARGVIGKFTSTRANDRNNPSKPPIPLRDVPPQASAIASTSTPSGIPISLLRIPLAEDSESSSKPNSQPEPSTSGSTVTASSNAPHGLGDRARTKARYDKATERLEKSLNRCPKHWQPFDLPKFDDIANDADLAVSQVQELLQNMFNARDNSPQDTDFWSKAKRGVTGAFLAIAPFAKVFLQVAKEGASVSLCICFILTIDTGSESLWNPLRWFIALDNGRLRRNYLTK